MKTINILGLGESLKTYIPNGEITIGVNDIIRFHPVDFLVLADPPKVFKGERLRNICKGIYRVYSHYSEWSLYFRNFEKISCAPGRATLSALGTNLIPKSNNSTFIATCLAYRLGATEIILYGVDFLGHKTLSQPATLKVAVENFRDLRIELARRKCNLYLASDFGNLRGVIPVKRY